MMTTVRVALRLLRMSGLLIALPCVLTAQQQRPASPTDATKREVVDSVASMLEQMYADPDTGRFIASRIRERLSSGAYRQANDWQHFARALTGDLQSINRDTHLWVEVGPPAPPPGLHGPFWRFAWRSRCSRWG